MTSSAPSSIADRIANLDWTQLQRGLQSDEVRQAVDLAPTTTQKASMQAHRANNEIIWNIARLFCQQHIESFLISKHSEHVVNHYIDYIADNTLSASEYQTLSYLLSKLSNRSEVARSFILQIYEFQPTFCGIPFKVSTDAEGTIHFAVKDSMGTASLEARNFADMRRIFNAQDGMRIMVAAFFYFLDLRELLSQNKRPRGQTIPRFLKVFASPTLNNLFYSFFAQMSHAARTLLIENGLEWDNVTLDQILERVGAINS